MKTKSIIIIFACVLLTVFALGVTDVARMASTDTVEETASSKDRLIGVLITTEPLDLFDMESYFSDHAKEILSGGTISESESAAYEGRLYAALVDKPYFSEETGETKMIKEYAFDGVNGFSYYSAMYSDEAGSYHGNSGDEAISDGHMAINSTDAGDSIALEGTIYVSTGGGPSAFFFNPIYQTAQGEVYVVTGQGLSHSGDISEGMSSTHEIKEELSSTVGDETESAASAIKTTISFIDPPTGVSVIQLNGESQVLSREVYAPGKLPEKLSVERGTQYVVVETKANGANGETEVTRELYQPGDESFYAFYCREDGICVKQFCGIEWHD